MTTLEKQLLDLINEQIEQQRTEKNEFVNLLKSIHSQNVSITQSLQQLLAQSSPKTSQNDSILETIQSEFTTLRNLLSRALER